MPIEEGSVTEAVADLAVARPNGAAWAAYVAAGIGSFAVGFVVIINELGLTIPAIYGPAGGVSGRTTLAVVIWLVAWLTLHARWKNREVNARRLGLITLILIALGILGTFPPLWGVL